MPLYRAKFAGRIRELTARALIGATARDEVNHCASCGFVIPPLADFVTPDGLVCIECQQDGAKVQTPDEWLEARRQALLEQLREVEAAQRTTEGDECHG